MVEEGLKDSLYQERVSSEERAYDVRVTVELIPRR